MLWRLSLRSLCLSPLRATRTSEKKKAGPERREKGKMKIEGEGGEREREERAIDLASNFTTLVLFFFRSSSPSQFRYKRSLAFSNT